MSTSRAVSEIALDYVTNLTHDPKGNRVSKPERELLCIIAGHLNDADAGAQLSKTALTLLARKNTNEVGRLLRSLRDRGLIGIHHEVGENNLNLANSYTLPGLPLLRVVTS